MKDWLIDEILEITNSPQSTNFYKKAIKEIGEGRVEEELGELKHQIRLGKVKDPAKYLTTLLNKQTKANPMTEQTISTQLATYKSQDQIQLFVELKVQGETDTDKTKASLDIIYREDIIKFPTLMSSSFFTLHTNKSKSDEVPIKLVTHDGVLNGTLVRGKIKRGTQEKGILTSFDGRVFLAVIHLWQGKGRIISKTKLETGQTHSCGVVTFNISELIRKVYPNIKIPGDIHRLEFINSLESLCDTPYCIYCKDGTTEIYHGFTLLGMPSLTGIRSGRQTEKTGITVMLSPEITRQYINKHYLNRNEQLTKVRSEIAFLLWLYLEPRLESLDGFEYHAEMKHLIKELRLPEANWHKYPFHRKRVFDKAIQELKGKKTGSGKTINTRIEKGIFDYVLIAKLV